MALLSPDHLTRHDLSVDESMGESGYQYAIQWLFYLILVSTAVKVNNDPEAETSITFASLWISSTTSIISLSWGQFKVLLGSIVGRK